MNQENSKENSSKKEDQGSTIMMKKNKIQLEPLDDNRKNSTKAKSNSKEKESNRTDEEHVIIYFTYHINIISQTMPIQSTNNREEKTFAPKKFKNQRKLYSKNQVSIQNFMESPPIQWFIVFMVAIYTILIFVLIALEDLLSQEQLQDNLLIFSIIELCILGVFVLEIILSSYAWGIKTYFKDRWLVLDAIIICLSVVFVLIELSVQMSKIAGNIISIAQAIFRFLRIFLLIRKAQTFKKFKTSAVKTPAEKIIDFLYELKEIVDDDIDTLLDLDYCIDKIASNQLYEPAYMFDDDQDAYDWITYGASKAKSSNENKKVIHKSVTKQTKGGQSKAMLMIPQKIKERLVSQHDDLYINPFEIHQLSGEQGLVNLMIYLFDTNDLFEVLDTPLDTFIRYFTQIMNGYLDNLYHNKVHAFDVTQTCNFFIKKCKFEEVAELSSLDVASMYIAAAIHDYQHFGVNNKYLIDTQHELSITYNDKSILENFHISTAFQLTQNQEYNIYASLSKENYKKIREQIIGMVLSTDMSNHFADISKCRSRISSPDFDLKGKDKTLIMKAVLHSCDISNPIKQFDMYKAWTERVIGEFWEQGDKERSQGLPICFLGDRYTTNIAKAQGGFIDFVVRPLMQVVNEVLPEFNTYYENLDINKAKWAELVPYYDEHLSKEYLI